MWGLAIRRRLRRSRDRRSFFFVVVTLAPWGMSFGGASARVVCGHVCGGWPPCFFPPPHLAAVAATDPSVDSWCIWFAFAQVDLFRSLLWLAQRRRCVIPFFRTSIPCLLLVVRLSFLRFFLVFSLAARGVRRWFFTLFFRHRKRAKIAGRHRGAVCTKARRKKRATRMNRKGTKDTSKRDGSPGATQNVIREKKRMFH
nr:hypothetical protein [Pandoravirus massiliensis]